MSHSARSSLTSQELLSGRDDSLDRLMPAVYDQLRAIARRHLAGSDANGTLTPTGLVHERWVGAAKSTRDPPDG